MSKRSLATAFGDMLGGNEWSEYANCRNMDIGLFFPEIGENVDPFVKEVCAECPVNIECLWYANETSTDFGVYGGLSPRKRREWRAKNKIGMGQSYADWMENGYRPNPNSRH